MPLFGYDFKGLCFCLFGFFLGGGSYSHFILILCRPQAYTCKLSSVFGFHVVVFQPTLQHISFASHVFSQYDLFFVLKGVKNLVSGVKHGDKCKPPPPPLAGCAFLKNSHVASHFLFHSLFIMCMNRHDSVTVWCLWYSFKNLNFGCGPSKWLEALSPSSVYRLFLSFFLWPKIQLAVVSVIYVGHGEPMN